MHIPCGRSKPRLSHTACNRSKTRVWFRCACWQWLCPFCLPDPWMLFERSHLGFLPAQHIFSTCMDLHIDIVSDGGQLYTEGNGEHQGDECQPCSYFPSSRVEGGGFISLWDGPASHCGIFVRIVEALTSIKIILRYTHNARIVWMWTYGIALTSAISFCSINAVSERIYTFFVCCVFRTMCDVLLADGKGPQNDQDSRSWHTHYHWFSASPLYAIQAYILAYIYNGLLYDNICLLSSFVFRPMTLVIDKSLFGNRWCGKYIKIFT